MRDTGLGVTDRHGAVAGFSDASRALAAAGTSGTATVCGDVLGRLRERRRATDRSEDRRVGCQRMSVCVAARAARWVRPPAPSLASRTDAQACCVRRQQHVVARPAMQTALVHGGEARAR